MILTNRSRRNFFFCVAFFGEQIKGMRKKFCRRRSCFLRCLQFCGSHDATLFSVSALFADGIHGCLKLHVRCSAQR